MQVCIYRLHGAGNILDCREFVEGSAPRDNKNNYDNNWMGNDGVVAWQEIQTNFARQAPLILCSLDCSGQGNASLMENVQSSCSDNETNRMSSCTCAIYSGIDRVSCTVFFTTLPLTWMWNGSIGSSNKSQYPKLWLGLGFRLTQFVYPWNYTAIIGYLALSISQLSGEISLSVDEKRDWSLCCTIVERMDYTDTWNATVACDWMLPVCIIRYVIYDPSLRIRRCMQHNW